MPVEINFVTQRGETQRALNRFGAGQNASLAALALAVASVALVAAGTGVALSRDSGSTHSQPAALSRPTTTPGGALSPAAVAAEHHARPRTRPAVSPRALLAKAVANALARGSVHAIARNVSGHLRAVFDDYDNNVGGIQHISIYGGHVTVRVVGSTTYFTGDKRGLTRYMGFTAAEVATLRHRWLRLTAGEAGYRAVTAGVTLAATLHEDRIGAPLRLLPQRTRGGVAVIGVRGRALGGGAPKHATATMWISVGSDPLPVEFDARNGHLRLAQRFTDWGKPFRLAPPANVFGQRTLRG